MALSLAQPSSDDIGALLFKVQEDLTQLKSQFDRGQSSEINHSDLKQLIRRTELSVKHASEQYASLLSNQVQNLPFLDARGRPTQLEPLDPGGYPSPSLLTRPLSGDSKLALLPRRALSSAEGMAGGLDLSTLPPGERAKAELQQKFLLDPTHPQNRVALREKLGITLPQLTTEDGDAVANVNSRIVKGQTVLPLGGLPSKNRYDPQLPPPKITDRDAKAGIRNLLERGLIPPAAQLTLQPPPVVAMRANVHPDDAKQPKQMIAAPIYDMNTQLSQVRFEGESLLQQSPSSTFLERPPGQLGNVSKFRNYQSQAVREASAIEREKRARPTLVGRLSRTPISSAHGRKKAKRFEEDPQPPPPATPASAAGQRGPAPGDIQKRSRFAVQNAVLRDDEEYQTSKQRFCFAWHLVEPLMPHITSFCALYALPVVFFDTQSVIDYCTDNEERVMAGRAPQEAEILNMIINRPQIERLLAEPGRRYRGKNGQHEAATTLQKNWRRFLARRAYLSYRNLKWNAGMIAIKWMMMVKLAKMRRSLRQTRLDQLAALARRNAKFAADWSRIKSSHRVEIHVNSLGYPPHVRRALQEDLPALQNLQMAGRICSVADPNVDVIYISPIPLSDDQLKYYERLIGLQPQIDKDYSAPKDRTRFTIIEPTHLKSFPLHPMSLSTLLNYSARTLKRIRHLIRGRDAYIVPSAALHPDDIAVAHALNVPMMRHPDPAAAVYNTKSGGQRILQAAFDASPIGLATMRTPSRASPTRNFNYDQAIREGVELPDDDVTIPPYVADVYNHNQMHDALSNLIVSNILTVTRWLFKIDDQVGGRGIGYFDADSLPSHAWVVKQAKRYGDKWSKSWAQQPSYQRVLIEIELSLAQSGCIANLKPDEPNVASTPALFNSWQTFIIEFLSKGGLIQAHPSADSFGQLTADLFIEPDGKVNIRAVGDQIQSDAMLQAWGYSVPQSSVEPEVLKRFCELAAKECFKRHLFGHVSIDFVTFMQERQPSLAHTNAKNDDNEEDDNAMQVVWATGIKIGYTDSQSLIQLLSFATHSDFDPTSGLLTIANPKPDDLSEDGARKPRSKRRRKDNSKKRERFAATGLTPKERAKQEQEKLSPKRFPRYAALSCNLVHSNLQMVHYSVFFEMCRAHGVGFDVEEKEGTVFGLVETHRRDRLVMLTVSDSLQGALVSFARNMNVLHQEISAPNMQGRSNFKGAISCIEGIIGETIENTQEPHEQLPPD